jgi:hypothetical protein
MLLDAIVKLHDKIQNMKLGSNRERQVTELEEARLRRLPLLAAIPGAHSPGANRPGDQEQGVHYHGAHEQREQHGAHQ